MKKSLVSITLVLSLAAMTLLLNSCATSDNGSAIDIADSSAAGISSSLSGQISSPTASDSLNNTNLTTEEVKLKDFIPNETILAEQDGWSTIRFNSKILVSSNDNHNQFPYYLQSNFVVPTEWVEPIKNNDKNNLWESKPFYMQEIGRTEDLNAIFSRIESKLNRINNEKPVFSDWEYELVEEVNIKGKKWIRYIQSAGAKRRNHFNDFGEVFKCEGWWHCIYYATYYEDYIVEIAFSYDDVDENVCVTNEDFKLQERVLESWETMGVVKVIDEQ